VFLTSLVVAAVSFQVPKVRIDPKHPNTAVEDRLDKYWQKALTEVYKSHEEIFSQRLREYRRGSMLPALVSGDPHSKDIALTFDDGPHPQFTPQLLAVLKRENVTATFFVIGKQVELYPNLIKDENAAGHVVGNHTFSHVTLTHIPEEDVETEYRSCSDLVQSIIGKRPKFCRPPGGDYDDDVLQAASNTGLTTTLWTDDPGDYASPGVMAIETRTIKHLKAGAIILLHDGIQETIDILPKLIQIARAKGLNFVGIDKLKPSTQDQLLTRLLEK
jgi:peptidoglycan/xylan/chitin deacetylase (PgdA/CDA1 family)